MKKTLALSLFLLLASLSCKTSDKGTDKLKIAKKYYNVLDTSDYPGISTWFVEPPDSLITIEGDYKMAYSQDQYLELLKWDAVFDPSYDILDIAAQDGIVLARISKMDKRIAFLHEKPFITKQTLRFKNDKIAIVETEYENFDETTWERNRTALLTWIDENHPELNEFIYDQTEVGGTNFLKAIDLYTNRE